MKKKIFFGLAFLLLLLSIITPLQIRNELRHDIRLFEGQEHLLPLQVPLSLYIRADKDGIIDINGSPVGSEVYNRLSTQTDLALTGLTSGNVKLKFSLFNGLIPIRELTVSVFPEKEVYPGGHSIGIKLHDQGVIVAGYHYLKINEETFFSPAEEAGIEIGDIIISLNNQELKGIDRAVSTIKNEASRGPLKVEVKRKGEIYDFYLEPHLCSQAEEYRIGLYIRDTAAGVGTLTFYDPQSRFYGALGHVITDIDSKEILEINEGVIVQADVVNIKMAQRGQPGEKAGIFREGQSKLGTIVKNTNSGIYGKLDHNLERFSSPYPDPLPVALAFQVENGPAEMLTVLEGNTIESYSVHVERTSNPNMAGDKGIVIRITDERLLGLTGGIVQGMSGSPIIQNGRIVGAVTHVFVNDPARGYAIYAEWMLNECGVFPVS